MTHNHIGFESFKDNIESSEGKYEKYPESGGLNGVWLGDRTSVFKEEGFIGLLNAKYSAPSPPCRYDRIYIR